MSSSIASLSVPRCACESLEEEKLVCDAYHCALVHCPRCFRFLTPGTATDMNRGAGVKRLQPSEPLHMTTRRAVSTTGSVATASRQASVAAEDVPPISFSEPSQNVGGSDFDSERPAKRVKRSSEGSEAESSNSNADAVVNDLAEAEDEEYARANNETGSRSQSSAENGVDAGDFSVALNEALSNTAHQSIEGLSAPVSTRGGRRRGKRRGRWWGRRAIAADGMERTPHDSPGQAAPVKISENRSPDKPEPGDIIKRLPGRRRAPHADPVVEADLRRQLELKVAYRAVVKALKPILAELAERTARELNENTSLYEQYEEFDEITADLDARLASRLSILQARLREEEQRLEREKLAREHIVKAQFNRVIHDTRDDYGLRAKHEFLSVLRKVDKDQDSDCTDDEDGDIIPKLHAIHYPDGERIVLDDAYDSRSRFFVESDRLFNEADKRCKFMRAQSAYDKDSFVRRPKGFAVYDGEVRRRGNAVQNLYTLAEASEEVEAAAAKAKREISNAAALGLQALVTATDMSAAAPARTVTPKIKQQPKETATPPHRELPPHVPAQTPPTFSNTFQPVVTPSQGVSHHGAAQHSSSVATPATLSFQPPLTYQPESTHATLSASVQRQNSREIRPLLPHVTELSMHTMSNGSNFGAPQMSTRSSDYFSHDRLGNIQDNPPPLTVETSNLSSGPASPSPRTPGAATKQRKRPGPRAHYSFQSEPKGIVHFQGGHAWSPFDNALGPPTGLPRYMKETDQTKRGANPTSATSPSGASPQSTVEEQHPQSFSAFSHQPSGGFEQRARVYPIAPANTPGTPYSGGGSTHGTQYNPPGSSVASAPPRYSPAMASPPPKPVPAYQINPFVPSPAQTNIFQHNPFLHNPAPPPPQQQQSSSSGPPSLGTTTTGPQSFVWSSTQAPQRAQPAPSPLHARFPTYAPPASLHQPHSPPPAPQPAAPPRHHQTPSQASPPLHQQQYQHQHQSQSQSQSQSQLQFQHQKILPANLDPSRQHTPGVAHQVILPKPAFAQRGPYHSYSLPGAGGNTTPIQQQGGHYPPPSQNQGQPPTPTGQGRLSFSVQGSGSGHGQPPKQEKKPREIRFENFTPRP